LRRGSHKHIRVVEIDPTAVGRPGKATQLSRRQNDAGISGSLKVDPPDVRAVGVPAEVFLAGRAGRAVHAKIIRRCIGVTRPIGGCSSAHLDPADVGRVDETRAEIRPDINAIGRARAPISKTDIRGPRVAIRRIDRCVSARCAGECEKNEEQRNGGAFLH
jgi:hypothetical protein